MLETEKVNLSHGWSHDYKYNVHSAALFIIIVKWSIHIFTKGIYVLLYF